MSNSRELRERLEAQARRRADLARACHRPMWLSDAEPGHGEDDGEGWRNVGRVLALLVIVACACLACQAWAWEDDLAAKRTRETVAQMEGK
jgi:hypothetical protein